MSMMMSNEKLTDEKLAAIATAAEMEE